MPISSVQAALDIASDTALPHNARTALQIAQRNLTLQLQLVDDLLDVSRMKSDKLRLDLSLIDLHTILRDLSAYFRSNPSIGEFRCDLELQATQFHVAGDMKHLRQIFRNLLKHVAMHSGKSRQILIRTANRMEQLVVELEVSSSDETELLSIQKLFAQQSDRWPVISGELGLGLSICSSLVDLHHGNISVQSNGSGTGMVFTVALPFVEQSPMQVGSGSMPLPADGVPHRVRQTILLVDDHVDMVTVFRQLLQHRGYEVLVAFTMAEALELAERESFDILISDIGLPDGNGIELLRQLAEQGPIKAIAVSGYGTQRDIQRSLTAGYALHLIKPFSVKSLCDAIDNILEADGY